MNRRLRLSLPCLLALQVPACGTSPSAPEAMRSFEVSTPHGKAVVEATTSCTTSSAAEIKGEIEQGYRRALREAPEAGSVSVEPLLIYVMGERSQAVWFDPPADRVEYGCGDEGAIEHEMGHRIAYYLGRSCFKEVWHGVDLNCQPL